MKRIIVTDSSSNISQALAKQLGIVVLPLSITIDQKDYQDEIELSTNEVYQHIIDGRSIKTSQPNPYNVEQILTKLSKEYDEVVCITIPKNLSGTNQLFYTTAINNELANVTVLDCNTLCNAMAAIVTNVNKMHDQPISVIEEYVTSQGLRSQTLIFPNTLTQLANGGRISPAVAKIGNLIKLKVLLKFYDGQTIDKEATARTEAKIFNLMMEELANMNFDSDTEMVNILHADYMEKAIELSQLVTSKYPNAKIKIDDLPAVLAAHAGIKTVAIQTSTLYE